MAATSAPVPRWEYPEIIDARFQTPRGANPTHPGPSSENGEVEVSEKFFAKTMEKLHGAIPKRYGNSTQPPTIYSVPDELKSSYEDEGYEPVAVRIGISRHYSRCTEQLQDYKWCCVRQLIQHNCLLEPAKTPVLLLGCLASMKHLEPQIRASYSYDIRYSSNELARRMVLDGCFILHRLLKYARREANGGDNDNNDDWTQVFGRCWVWQLVTRDLLLLQNQIPFFVLRELFKQLRNDDEPEDSLVKGSLQIFRSLGLQMLHPKGSTIACDDVHHLLHLFYISVGLPPTPSDCQRPRRQADVSLSVLPQWIPCAKELEEAGVRFRKRKNATSFLDIKFDLVHGVLEIPPLQLYDYSNALFRNLIAFEQTYPHARDDISTYATFMDCLINTPEDMRILHLRGILVNQMNGEQDASRFFSRICGQVHWSADNYLVVLMDEVSKYRNFRRHRWRAFLVRNYFSNPWVAISVLVAVFLLVMTVLQTFFTVYPYFKPSK